MPINSKRVCIIRRAYYPAESHVRRNATSLAAAGYQVDVVCLRNYDEPAADIVESVNIHRMPLHARRRGLLGYLIEYFIFFLMAFVTVSWLHLQQPFAIVEADSMPDFLIFAGILPHLLGARLILYLFESMPEIWAQKRSIPMSHWTIRLLFWQEFVACQFADEIICCHDMAKDVLVQRGVPGDKITVILNVPDEQVFRRDYCTSKVNNDGVLHLIQHGTITENYGIQIVLNALSLLDPSLLLCFDIVGEGEFRSDLEADACRLGLHDRVVFHGFVSRDCLLELLCRADIGIVPMLFEYQSPNKMFEFVALGKPLIASDRKTFRQYFDEKEIAYFNTGDAKDLARVITSAVRNREALKAQADRATSRYQNYRWQNMKTRYLIVYNKFCVNDYLK